MAPHQQRVVDEQVALDEKLTKLLVFIGTPLYHSLEEPEQKRLQRQLRYMQQYSEVLAERIAAF